MRHTLLLGAFLLCLNHLSIAQHSEIGIFFGLSSYEGDLNKRDLFLPAELHPSFGVEYNRVQSEALSFGGVFNVGKITGDDQNFEDRKVWTPNLSFSSPISEMLMDINWSPLFKRKMKVYDVDTIHRSFDMDKFKEQKFTLYDKNGIRLEVDTIHHIFVGEDENRNTYIYDQKGHLTIYDQQGAIIGGHYKKRIAPYIMTGFGFSFTNPDPKERNLESGELMDYSTLESYSNTNITIPLGGGILYDVSEKMSFALEAAYRYPFTDYIDGISKNRDPEDNDWYLLFGLKARYKVDVAKKDYYPLIKKGNVKF